MWPKARFISFLVVIFTLAFLGLLELVIEIESLVLVMIFTLAFLELLELVIEIESLVLVMVFTLAFLELLELVIEIESLVLVMIFTLAFLELLELVIEIETPDPALYELSFQRHQDWTLQLFSILRDSTRDTPQDSPYVYSQ